MEEQYAYINTQSGHKRRRKITNGCLLFIKWKDGNTSSEPLVSLKESNPVEISEYAVSRKLHNGPTFVWWVTYTIKKCTRIFSVVKSQYHK